MAMMLITDAYASLCKSIECGLCMQLASFMEELHSDGLLDEDDPQHTKEAPNSHLSEQLAAEPEMHSAIEVEQGEGSASEAERNAADTVSAEHAATDAVAKAASSTAFIGPALPLAESKTEPAIQAASSDAEQAAAASAENDTNPADAQLKSQVDGGAAEVANAGPVEQRVGLLTSYLS